jgi:hypothetical protein
MLAQGLALLCEQLVLYTGIECCSVDICGEYAYEAAFPVSLQAALRVLHEADVEEFSDATEAFFDMRGALMAQRKLELQHHAAIVSAVDSDGPAASKAAKVAFMHDLRQRYPESEAMLALKGIVDALRGYLLGVSSAQLTGVGSQSRLEEHAELQEALSSPADARQTGDQHEEGLDVSAAEAQLSRDAHEGMVNANPPHNVACSDSQGFSIQEPGAAGQGNALAGHRCTPWQQNDSPGSQGHKKGSSEALFITGKQTDSSALDARVDRPASSQPSWDGNIVPDSCPSGEPAPHAAALAAAKAAESHDAAPMELDNQENSSLHSNTDPSAAAAKRLGNSQGSKGSQEEAVSRGSGHLQGPRQPDLDMQSMPALQAVQQLSLIQDSDQQPSSGGRHVTNPRCMELSAQEQGVRDQLAGHPEGSAWNPERHEEEPEAAFADAAETGGEEDEAGNANAEVWHDAHTQQVAEPFSLGFPVESRLGAAPEEQVNAGDVDTFKDVDLTGSQVRSQISTAFVRNEAIHLLCIQGSIS